MYRSILVPLDGSTFAEHALPVARGLARRTGARLHLVLVHHAVAPFAGDITPVSGLGSLEHDHRKREEYYLGSLAEQLRGAGLDAVPETLEGDVARRLVERAGEDADLVVMATHGRGGLERAWLGSVADAVLRRVQVPVLLVRPHEDVAEETRECDFGHVLVATNGSAAAAAATREAVEIARSSDARLTLLHVVAVPAGLASPYLPHAAEMDRETTAARTQEATRHLEALKARIPGVERVSVRVVGGYHPARVILAEVQALEADLLAIGIHGRTRLARAVLGSVADKLVRAATVPTLVAHGTRRRDDEPDYGFESVGRISPSWATDATSRPSRV